MFPKFTAGIPPEISLGFLVEIQPEIPKAML